MPSKKRTTFGDEFIRRWEENKLDKKEGPHRFDMFEEGMCIEINGIIVAIQKLSIQYNVKIRHYFKFFTPTDYRGINNFITEKFKASYIVFNEEIPFINDGTWKYIPTPDSIPLSVTHLKIEQFDFGMHKMMKAVFKQ
jgi:hypothetical protein